VPLKQEGVKYAEEMSFGIAMRLGNISSVSGVVLFLMKDLSNGVGHYP